MEIDNQGPGSFLGLKKLTNMGNPFPTKSPIQWVFMSYSPNKYHGYTVRGTTNCPLKHVDFVRLNAGDQNPQTL